MKRQVGFRVGDRVRLRAGYRLIPIPLGTLGTVRGEGPYFPYVEFDGVKGYWNKEMCEKHHVNPADVPDNTWAVDPQEIERVEVKSETPTA